VPKGYRRLSVFVIYKNKINKISQADLPANHQWVQASNGFCVGFGAPQNPEEYKTFDVKLGVWLPTTSTIADLKSDSIALVHVDFANSYSNDATAIATILSVAKK
jgi:hypothetical protein